MDENGEAPEPKAETSNIVGGGPAGLFAAEILSGLGHSVVVHDHMASVGRKFLLAGRGGLNLTHSEPLDAFLGRYAVAAPVLEPAIRSFGPHDLADWAASLGEPTFVGSSGRLFPESFRATPLLRAWLGRLADAGVTFRLRSKWTGWSPEGDLLFETPDGPTQAASESTLFALGGASWPRVGSDGGWVSHFERAGVQVNPLRPANCGIKLRWAVVFADRFAGTPVKNVAVTVDDNRVRGELMVTTAGLEGGAIYAQGAAIRAALDAGEAQLIVDLQPDLTVDDLASRLSQRRRPKDSVSTWLRRAGFEPVEAGLMREATKNRLPDGAEAIAKLAKAVPLPVEALMPIDRAISTAGGISLNEVDESFMLARMPGTFVAGEILDWEAPTGGYLLQATFSTAYVAAQAMAQRLS